MSDLGPLSYGKKQEEIFLGREINQHRDYSEATAIQIDREVRKIVDGQMDRVTQLLSEHRQELINLAEALLVHEVLEADEIKKAMTGELLSDTRKSRSYLKGKTERRSRSETAAPAGPTSETDPSAYGNAADKPKDDGKSDEDEGNKGGRFDATV
jgi:cell division protease FtsH